jgi:hypothetical protein
MSLGSIPAPNQEEYQPECARGNMENILQILWLYLPALQIRNFGNLF